MNEPNIYIQPRKRVPHVLHGILTAISCGLWAPIWIADALIRGRG